MGIVAFAGAAFLACPVTLDYGAFHESLSAIDTNTIPRGGTDISTAIQAAQAALRRRPNSDKILILVTDGEDLEGSAFETAQAAAKGDGLKIFTVGVGTAAGDLIPIAPGQGGGFVKDDSGAFVKSRLDETALKAIAGATGGFYVPLGTQGEGLELIFQTVLGSIAKHELASRRQKIYIERFQWPLAASLAMLLSSLAVGSRRRGRAAIRASAAVAVSMVAIAVTLQPAHADSIGESKQPVLEYNAGTAAYRAGQFPQAAQSFQQSISHVPSGDPKQLAVQEDAYYNLGNTLYRSGQKTEQTSPQDTLQKWNDAVKAYETALQLRADDADSKFNRDLVKRKIDALKQQQNQSNQQNNNKNQNKDPNPGQGKGQGQGQSQQNNPPQNKDQPPPPGSGQPQGQPPPQSDAKNNDPKQDQKQDPKQSQGQTPPPQDSRQQNSGQQDSGQQDSGQQDSGPPKSDGPPRSAGQPPPAAAGGDQKPDEGSPPTADNQRAPGEMTREEARELLDSVKGDEKHLAIPWAQRGAMQQPPDKPFKNW